jgi:hypothetical protein
LRHSSLIRSLASALLHPTAREREAMPLRLISQFDPFCLS